MEEKGSEERTKKASKDKSGHREVSVRKRKLKERG